MPTGGEQMNHAFRPVRCALLPALAFFLAGAFCCSGVTEVPEPDGAVVTHDNGVTEDTGHVEADVGAAPDAGAGDDAGTPKDAGGVGDSGTVDAGADGGAVADAGTTGDVGTGEDTGVRDSGTAHDAGAGQDAQGGGDTTHDAGAADGGPDSGQGSFPVEELDDLSLYVNLGDSMGAGYNATGHNGTGGKGYARLMLDNHPDYPAYTGHHLKALYPGVQFKDIANSGDTSSDQLKTLKSSILFFPAASGDVLVSLTCGGNDFNNDINIMLFRAQTETAAATLQDNYREIAKLIRQKYENIPAGKKVVFLVTNVTDPTGGTGNVPSQYNDGFCKTIHNPLFTPQLRTQAIGNLAFFNDKIAEVTAEIGGHLVDSHGVYLNHGMNASGSDRWLDIDCVHPTDEGHHQLRREEWFVLTGERF